MSTEKDFRILEDYVLPPKAPPQTEEFFRYVKPSQEELDVKLEYDMDEEDFAWLELFNDQRSKSGLGPVSFDAFEALMDRFEKECFFHCTSKNFKPVPPELEHLSDCAICLEGTSREDNMILFCDMCCLSVHQKCYGVIRVPEEIWLCKRCLHSPAAVANCCLCSCKSGALKRTLDHKWAHVVCTFWIPEASFGNDRAREPIMGVDGIPSFRCKLTCFVCNQKGKGACLQCQHSNCSTAYHATCAQLVGLSMKMEMYMDADGVTKKKVTTFCDVHSSLTEESSVNSDIREFSGPKYPSSSEDDDDNDGEQELKEKSSNLANAAGVQDTSKSKKLTSWKSRLKKARKVLAAWMDMEQPIFVPVVTVATINKITRKARELELEKYEAFVTRLHSYWTLKRQSRDGYPLLSSRKFGENIRILNVNLHLSSGSSTQQNKPSTTRDASIPSTTNSSHSEPPIPARCIDTETASKESDLCSNKKHAASKHEDEEMLESDDNDDVEDDDDDDDDVYDEAPHLRDCQRLRQDLEKVRLLIELVKKREKMKMEQVRLRERQIMLEFFPNYNKFKWILEELKVFLGGTSSHVFEDGGKYFEVIQNKLDQFSYDTFEEFAADLKFLCGSSNSVNREIFEKTNAFIEQVVKSYGTASLNSSPSSSDTSHLFPKPIFIPMSDPKGKHDCSAMTIVSPQSADDGGSSSRGRARKRRPSAMKSGSGFQYHGSIEGTKDKLLMEPVVSLTSMTSATKVPTSNRGRPRKQKQSPSNSRQEENPSFVRPSEAIPRERESFKTYRMISSPKSDEDDYDDDKRENDVVKAKKAKTSSSESESRCEDENQNKNNNNVEEETSDDDDDDDDDDEGPSHEFKPFDLVWAKCHNTPWYPAMVISPDTPPPLSLRIQLPVVPQQTVDILSEKPQLKLVLFFDGKFTWKCIPINKLLPLGTNPAIDKGKLLDSKKMNIRKIIQAAYDRALQYQQAEPHLSGTGAVRVQPQQNTSELMKHDLLHHHHHHLQHSLSGSQQQYQLELQQLQQQLRQQIIRESTPSESSSPPPSKSFTQSNRSTSPKASSPTNHSATVASSSSSSSSKVGDLQNEARYKLLHSNNTADEQGRAPQRDQVEMTKRVSHKKIKD